MIERFNSACCYPTLPEVFGKEFSYYEEICAIITKLNEVISAINNFNGVTKEYVDNQLTALESDLTRLIEETNAQTKQELIGIITEIQNSIIDLKTYIDNKAYSALLDSKSYTDNKCNDILIEIDKINFANTYYSRRFIMERLNVFNYYYSKDDRMCCKKMIMCRDKKSMNCCRNY